MKDAMKANTAWKYYINLPSQVFPLKTNEEIVQILRVLNGSNCIQTSPVRENHVRRRFMYKVWYSETKGQKPVLQKGNATARNPPPPHNITIFKGSAYGFFRQTVLSFFLVSALGT